MVESAELYAEVVHIRWKMLRMRCALHSLQMVPICLSSLCDGHCVCVYVCVPDCMACEYFALNCSFDMKKGTPYTHAHTHTRIGFIIFFCVCVLHVGLSVPHCICVRSMGETRFRAELEGMEQKQSALQHNLAHTYTHTISSMYISYKCNRQFDACAMVHHRK